MKRLSGEHGYNRSREGQKRVSMSGRLRRDTVQSMLEEQEKRTRKLTKWIVSNRVPFSIVDHENFRAFVSMSDYRYFLPARATITRRVVQEKQIMKQLLRVFLGKINHAVRITDAWSSVV